MFDEKDIIDNITTIYSSNNSLRILKDFERVLDELDVYVFKNWENGELIKGPVASRHWVECEFMWPKDKMPDPMGGKKLLDYNCKVSYSQNVLKKPRKIIDPGDLRPEAKKGIIDKHPIWIVNIKMPKKLMFDIFKGSIVARKESIVDLESFYRSYDNANIEMPKAEDTSLEPMDDLGGNLNEPNI